MLRSANAKVVGNNERGSSFRILRKAGRFMSEYLRSAIIVRYGNRNIAEYIPLDPWSTLSNRVKFYQIAF